MTIRQFKPRAGFRSIAPCCATLRAALERLARDGHLGQRKCAVSENFAPLVYKGGPTRRVWQGDSVGARVTKSLGVPAPDFAWLEVPAGLETEAAAICEELLHT